MVSKFSDVFDLRYLFGEEKVQESLKIGRLRRNLGLHLLKNKTCNCLIIIIYSIDLSRVGHGFFGYGRRTYGAYSRILDKDLPLIIFIEYLLHAL